MMESVLKLEFELAFEEKSEVRPKFISHIGGIKTFFVLSQQILIC